jgi:hypothetical protein
MTDENRDGAWIVRTRFGKGVGYGVRILDPAGLETEVLWSFHKGYCESIAASLNKAVTEPGRERLAMIALAALLHITDVARHISEAKDDLGGEYYATKAHMRAWAGEIIEHADLAIAAAGLDVDEPAP